MRNTSGVGWNNYICVGRIVSFFGLLLLSLLSNHGEQFLFGGTFAPFTRCLIQGNITAVETAKKEATTKSSRADCEEILQHKKARSSLEYFVYFKKPQRI